MFCPKDGTKCLNASEPGDRCVAYYRCPECSALWFYNRDAGRYEVVEGNSTPDAEDLARAIRGVYPDV